MQLQYQHVVWGLLGCLLLAGCQLKARNTPTVPQSESTPAPTSSLLPSPPKLLEGIVPATVSAESFVVYDPVSRQVVAGKHEHDRLMPASTTKIMTALVALEEYAPDEVLTVARASEAIGHRVDFEPGEQFRVIDMITGMMVNSGNDAAVALADHHPNGYQEFVSLMNQKAVVFGLKDTRFSNVSGVEADDHYSSAADLAKIGMMAMENPVFREIVATKESTIKTIDGRRTHRLKNLNELLWDVPGVIGIKTGWTENAKDCLVTYVSRNRDLIIVVLKSQDRFADSKILIDWAYRSLLWE